MPLYIDIRRRFEKNASKDLWSPVYRWHFEVCLKRFLKAF
jgi:hypothetical protein